MRSSFYTFLLLLFFVQDIAAQVIINEFSAANMDGITDNYGKREDWIELYNAGNVTVNLAGYYLTDNINNPTKWQFPAGITINPGQHLLVFASDRDEVSGFNFIHAGFKITQTQQEYIALFSPAGTLLDAFQITTPNQMNHSTGRVTDASPDWGIFQNPTPGAPNGTAYQGYAPKPTFSIPAGFFNGPLTLSLNAPAGAQIRYTLNGAEPTATSTLYTGSIHIAETTVVKARVYSDNPAILPGFTEANTYFINENHTVPVISVAGTTLATLLNGTQIEPRGSFELFVNGQLADEAYGEFNKHGNDSWAYQQRGIDYITRDQLGYTSSISHKIFPNKERKKFQRLILKAAANDNYPFINGAHIRDAYVQTLSQRASLELDERTYEPCILYVNGQYWGVYEIREKVDDPDFTRHYYDQGEKWIDYIKTWGGTWEEYGSRADWDALRNYIMSNDMSDPAHYEYVNERLNVLSLIDYMIINTHVVCMDWLNWNTSWWRGRNPDGEAKKWRYTLWDMDASFGHYVNYTGIPNTTPTADPCYAENLPADFEGHGQMISALMANDEFHSLYVNRYADLNNTYFSCEYMIGLLDELIERIEPEMPRQIEKWGGTLNQWLNIVQNLKNFINARCVAINPGIEDCYDVEGPYPVTVIIKPATSDNKVKVNTIVPATFPYTGEYFVGTTLNFLALPAPGWVFDKWEVQNNAFFPSPTASAMQLGLTGMDGETVTAIFRPAIPCSNAYDFVFNPTLSSIAMNWDGPPNFISYELGWRKHGSDDWTTLSVSNTNHTLYGLDVCTEYDLRLRSICDFGLGQYQEFVIKTECLTGDEEVYAGVTEWNVFPNPFGEQFTIDFILAKNMDVQIEVLAMTGQTLKSLRPGELFAGQHRFYVEDAQSWASGVYLVRLLTEEGSVSTRVIKR